MANNKDERAKLPDPDDYWPFPDDLDEYEREFSESLEGYKILPDPNWEENKRRVEETARRTLANEHPGRMTEEQRKLLPPGLLAYWRGEAPTPYADSTGWDEFRKTLVPSDDLWRLVPMDPDDNQPAPLDGQPLSDESAG